MSVFIPTIDFEAYDEQDDAALDDLASKVSNALTHSGFMKIINLGITRAQIDRTFELSKWFFSRSEQEKSTSACVSVEENLVFSPRGQGENTPDS